MNELDRLIQHNISTIIMASATVTAVLTTTIKAASAAAPPTSTNRATPQGGILEGVRPNEYSASDPIKLFIIQVRIGGNPVFI